MKVTGEHIVHACIGIGFCNLNPFLNNEGPESGFFNFHVRNEVVMLHTDNGQTSFFCIFTFCDNPFKQIVADFCSDLSDISYSNQRWFGDWVKYCGHGDVGYYLGCRFIEHLMESYSLKEIAKFSFSKINKEFKDYARQR